MEIVSNIKNGENQNQVDLSETQFREREADIVREGAKEGHRKRARQLKWSGGIPPMGYDMNKEGHLELNDEESFIIIRVFELYVEFMSIRDVSETLTVRGIVGKMGGVFGGSHIRRIIKNLIYKGIFTVGGNYCYVAPYRIVTDKLWDEADRILGMNLHEKRSINLKRDLDPTQFKVYITCPLECENPCNSYRYFTYKMRDKSLKTLFKCKDCNQDTCVYCGDPHYNLCETCKDMRLSL